MASPTKKLKVRRALAKASAAKGRKNKIRREGSTAPRLPLNMPNANEKAVQAAKA
ncbi:MAG: hypothetical protein OXT67_00385 [Zetaproteobacteria bacterium]|nr:hypothetical protein [Zetaproteobacteria bacterium]